MRQMPSVTVTTVPTLRASVCDLKFSMRDLMRSLISDALTDMMRILEKTLCGQFSGQAFEPALERTIDDEIAGLEDGAAQQAVVDARVQAHLSAQLLLQRRGVTRLLVGRELAGGDHLDVHGVLHFGLHLLEQSRDLGEESEAVVLREQRHEVAAVLVEARDPVDQAGDLRWGHVR